MNYMKMDTCDIANGKHFGVVLWVSGCDVKCKGCHNQCTWDFKAGNKFTEQTFAELLSLLDKPYIKRLTLSGGHPLAPQNIEEVSAIVAIVKGMLPDLEIWLYTGYDLTDDDFASGEYSGVLRICDYVVDGRFIEEERDIALPFRGSKNQRIIDVKKTIDKNEIITI